MKWKKILLCLVVMLCCLTVAFSGFRRPSGFKPLAQRQEERRDGAALVANVPVEARLRTKAAGSSLKGNMSLHLETSADQLKGGTITVRQFNLVFPAAPQAELSGREPKSKVRNDLLGVSIPASEREVQLRYDSRTQTASGEIPVQVHFPQLDELFPPVFVKDPTEEDFAVSRTQRGSLKLELKFAEPLDRSVASTPRSDKGGRASASASVQLEVYPLEDRGIAVPGYRLELSPTIRFDIGILVILEVANRLCLQPVRIRNNAADPSPTGAGLAFGMPGATTQWNKADVAFTVRDWMTVTNSALKVATSGAEEDQIRASVNVADCIEVFFVENFSPESLHGGGATWSSGTASAKIISSDGNATFGVDLTHLAHELGHVISMGHPGSPNGLFDSSRNTLMCPSGWHNDNPKRNSLDNKNHVSNPLFTFALKVKTPGPDCTNNGDCGSCP
ncbi:MAG TPA: hypothetical protein VJT09_08900 [Pyrinomonadaceae bacterium]|nr:hypothetical protein [Pyrinomonadaceae bacterium]